MVTLSQSIDSQIAQSKTIRLIALVLAGWFGVIFIVAAAGGFAARPDGLPIAIISAVVLPVAIFLALYRIQSDFRQFVLNLDIRLLTLLQAWRVVGAVFIGLLAYGLLPGLFAWPAGLGDIAIGVTAPFITWRLLRQAEFVRRQAFRLWHWLGLFDFVVALGTGVLASGIVAGLTEISTAPMQVLPLALIPGFLVPLFILLHLAVLLQIHTLDD